MQANKAFSEPKISYSRPVVIFTGIENFDSLREIVGELGGTVEYKDVQKATHLVTDKIRRTPKFISGISHCSFYLNPNWLLQSQKACHFLDESKFVLDDVEGEAKFGFKLKESLQNQNRTLFQSYHFYLTPSLLNRETTIKLITQAGGKVLRRNDTNCKDRNRYYVISCSEDSKFCREMLQQFPTSNFFDKEALFSSLLNQEIRFLDQFRFDAGWSSTPA
eukprot:TRINITY_DN3322_c0_g1_i1.p1 TRINITY_DN3322_c0_g1~~TRINITY_DN3322_c0_g1_i1.p1  ORF type:complete len:220 (+),score=27.47 TRINITY_DN3322_c0_g1_i1:446-1105(+)